MVRAAKRCECAPAQGRRGLCAVPCSVRPRTGADSGFGDERRAGARHDCIDTRLKRRVEWIGHGEMAERQAQSLAQAVRTMLHRPRGRSS